MYSGLKYRMIRLAINNQYYNNQQNKYDRWPSFPVKLDLLVLLHSYKIDGFNCKENVNLNI